MPWEKSFDEEVALEGAMQVFWGKGFEAASMTDLIEGTGINRGSLYNAFGGKRALFTRALLKYDRDARQTRLAKLEALDNPRLAISQFFDVTVAEAVTDTDRKGCFLINTSLELFCHDAEVNQIVQKGLGQLEAFFRRSIEVGQARSEIPTDIETEATAKTLVALLVAIRVLSRGVYKESSLQSIANQAKQLID